MPVVDGMSTVLLQHVGDTLVLEVEQEIGVLQQIGQREKEVVMLQCVFASFIRQNGESGQR